MGRKRSFLGFLATLFVAFFTANVFAAGYTCPSYKKYTKCYAGYYLNGTVAGNACKACPSNWTSAEGATAQSQCYRNIVLNKNGGSGKLSGTNVTDSSGGTANASIKCFYETACSFPSASGLTQSGSKRYAGWSTNSSNSSSTTQNFTITSTASTVTYYAARRPIYTITLNNQSATSAGTTAVYEVHGDGIYLNSALTQGMTTTAYQITAPTKTGYTFGGYYTKTGGSGTQMISANGYMTSNFTSTSFSAAGNLYAKWTPKQYTVSFNANNGSGGQSTSVTATYGSNMPSISTTKPTRTGYTFMGWYDNATYTSTSSTQYYTAAGASARTWNKTSDTTLYAGWRANTYTCSVGQYLNVTTCTMCEKGYYCPSTSNTYTYNGGIQGRTACAEGTYQPDTGETSCIPADKGYYVSGTAKTGQTICTGASYQDEKEQNACKLCPDARQTDDSATGYYGYYPPASPHTNITGCYAGFKKSLETGIIQGNCYSDENGVYGSANARCDGFSGSTCYGGYYYDGVGYIFSLNKMWENVCKSVGEGYYYEGGKVSWATAQERGQCDTGLTTIGYGEGANEAEDCGRKLHAGDNVIYLRSAERTKPSLRVKVGDTTFYGALSKEDSSPIKVKDGSTTYSVVNDWE